MAFLYAASKASHWPMRSFPNDRICMFDSSVSCSLTAPDRSSPRARTRLKPSRGAALQTKGASVEKHSARCGRRVARSCEWPALRKPRAALPAASKVAAASSAVMASVVSTSDRLRQPQQPRRQRPPISRRELADHRPVMAPNVRYQPMSLPPSFRTDWRRLPLDFPVRQHALDGVCRELASGDIDGHGIFSLMKGESSPSSVPLDGGTVLACWRRSSRAAAVTLDMTTGTRTTFEMTQSLR